MMVTKITLRSTAHRMLDFAGSSKNGPAIQHHVAPCLIANINVAPNRAHMFTISPPVGDNHRQPTLCERLFRYLFSFTTHYTDHSLF